MPTARANDDTIRCVRLPRHGGLELMDASFETHAFPRHSHPTYVIEMIEQGEDAFLCGARSYRAGSGCVVLINPETVHTGRPIGPQALSYRSLYPTPDLMRAFAPGVPERADSPGCWHGAGPVLEDPEVFTALRQRHAALIDGADPLHADELLARALGMLMLRHGHRPASMAAALGGRPARAAIAAAMDDLRDRFREQVSLSELAGAAGLSPFHFLRVFRAATGMPPHAFLMNVRVQHARELLARGVAPARAATASGFSDQSHLNRCFKRLVGTTPGRYRGDQTVA